MLLLVGLFAVALNLRPALTSVPPVLEAIRQELDLSRAEAGLLTTIPVLCMGLFALVATRVGERVGVGRGVSLALVLIGAATAGRVLGDAVYPLFACTLLAGVGIATAQTLLPAVVKEHFPGHAASVTGLYTMGTNIGAALAAGLTVPLEKLLDLRWPVALASWSLLAAFALVVWYATAERQLRSGGTSDARPTSAPTMEGVTLHSPRAWLVALFFGTSSCIFYSSLTWLAPFYQDRGFSAEGASLLLAVFTLAQIPVALAIPALADRSNDRRPWLAFSLAAIISGLSGVALAPLLGSWAPWAWAALLGVGMGGLFPLALTLPLDNTPDPASAGRLTAMTFFVGYVLSALGPFAVGWLRDAAGNYEVPFVALAALSGVMLAASLRFDPKDRPQELP